jgi:tRNA (cytidine32/guanosine34-2'-O)-methyltransferase
MAPQATLIFKIFLSPLDPHAGMLRSQLRLFFPGPLQIEIEEEGFQEFDDCEGSEGRCVEDELETSRIGKQGYDVKGRRGGVWVRKPRSSRPGSGGTSSHGWVSALTCTEAFLVCRNFDPQTVPLPPKFSQEALKALEQQTNGTLTLESLAHLVDGSRETKGWDFIKAYVGGGDLE